MKVVIAKKFRWRELRKDSLRCWYIGSEKAVTRVVAFFQSKPHATLLDTKGLLEGLLGNYAFILEMDSRVIAAVDKIRSYPIFYVEDGAEIGVSNSGRALKADYGLSQVNELSLLEFRMAGYVTGRETLYKRLYQLQAGEVLIWDKRGKGLERDRYYLFYSEITRGEKEEVLIEELDEITNSIFRRVIEESGGAPIWVPLSGGLDSRLVLCKLKQLGHDDLHAFSYGPLHNYDAKWAKHVAEKVGVPWVYVPYRKGAIKNFFFSKTRRDYWEFSGEYSSLPFMVDEFAVSVLKAKKQVSENAIFVNGQSGDFISGGHAHGNHLGMLEEGIQYPPSIITRAIVKKHLSQNRLLLQDVNLARISGTITSLLGIHDGELYSRDQVIKLYEWWEWQERQSKFVVNGQRSYDFFGHSWFLPLWGDEYLRFWKELGYEHKLKESLYKAYLERFDFYGVFRGFKPNLWNWQGVSMVILPIGWGVRKVFGDGVADSFYHHLSYFGKYQNHYAPFGFRKWVNRARDLKSPLALYVETWIEDNGMGA